MIAGFPARALAEPNSMVISESIAKKYFKSTDVIGKTMLIDDTTTWKITGVMKDMPSEAHFHFDFIKALPPEINNLNEAWLNPWATTYLLSKPGVSLKDINRMLAAIVVKYVGPQLQQMNPNSSGDIAKNGDFFTYYAMPLNKIHLFSNVSGEFEPNGNIRTVYIFIIIAILILIMACVNFMNLSTAFGSRRFIEIGVRKVLGSLRKNLIAQFLLESIIISFIATFLAILFAILLLPYFNELAGKHISASTFFKGWMILIYLLLALFVGLIAGSYPAFYLSAFKPLRILKEFLTTGKRSSWLRNSLVIFQFVIANILIVSTLVIYSQFNYIRERDLGYNRNQILTIANTYKLGTHAKTFKDEVARLPGVVGGTMTAYLPNHDNGGARAYFKNATAKPSETFLLGSWIIEANYIPLLGMKIVAGETFLLTCLVILRVFLLTKQPPAYWDIRQMQSIRLFIFTTQILKEALRSWVW
jgi:putative ABC transport system permease protein